MGEHYDPDIAATTPHPVSAARERVLVAALVVFGLLVRLTGIANHGLFYDDAWPAMVAHVGWRSALAMSPTDPGFAMVERVWLHVTPAGSWVRFVLPLTAGVLATVVGWWLGRTYGFGPRARIGLVALIAMSPEAIECSVRLKEYSTDLVLAMVILILVERVRRFERLGETALLAVVGSASCLVSLLLAPVVLGGWMALLVLLRRTGRRKQPLVAGAVVTSVVLLAEGWWSLRHTPTGLSQQWVSGKHLVDLVHHASWAPSTILLVIGGTVHGFFGVPMPAPHPFPTVLAAGSMRWIAVEALVVLIAVGWCSTPALREIRGREGAPELLAPLAGVVIAGAACCCGFIPLGIGRTELVVLPSIGLLIVHGLRRLRVAARMTGRTTRICALCAVLIFASAAWVHRAWYPAQDVRAVIASLHLHGDPTTAIAVARANTFTYVDEGIGPSVVHVSTRDPRGTRQGVWVELTGPRTLSEHLPTEAGVVSPPLTSLPAQVTELWIIGTTAEVASPADYHCAPGACTDALSSPLNAAALAAGWIPTGQVHTAPGVYAMAYGRRSPARGVPKE